MAHLTVKPEFGRAICSILGLNPDTVTRIEITLDARELPRIVVERLMTDEEDKLLINAAKTDFRHERLHFKLEKVEELGDGS